MTKARTNSESSEKQVQLHCAVVGEPNSGKSCYLMSLHSQIKLDIEWGPDLPLPAPTGLYSCALNWEVEGEACNLRFRDTHGDEEYSHLRPLGYNGVHVFLLFVAINDSKENLERAHSFWLPEIRTARPHVPIILVGTKTDMRGTLGENTISYEEGLALATKIGAELYKEISSLQCKGLVNLFCDAIKIGYEYREWKKSRKTKICTIL